MKLSFAKIDHPIKGTITVPGDKSISHRSIIFSALATGNSTINNLLESEDVLRTINAFKTMGVKFRRLAKNVWKVKGVGIKGLNEPEMYMDMGNSGTSTRLLIGLLSTFNFSSVFVGDKSLSNRPMKRIFEPVKLFGAEITSKNSDTLPVTIIGSNNPQPVKDYKMTKPSAQVKSAILLAGLNAPGTTSLIEFETTRNHTELMMKSLGIDLNITEVKINGKKGHKISITGQKEYQARNYNIPGDISSAAFFIGLALIIPGSDLTIENVGVNPTRTGIIDCFIEMGGNIKIFNKRFENEEEVADIRIKYSKKLKAISVLPSRAPIMIDEYPILSVVAAFAEGKTTMKGVSELRVKESDRIKSMVSGFKKLGIKTEDEKDCLKILSGPDKNNKNKKNKQIRIDSNLDHRIAMSFAIMSMAIDKKITIDNTDNINTSFPEFIETCKSLGAKVEIYK